MNETADNDRLTEAEIVAALRILAPGDDDNVTLGEIRAGLGRQVEPPASP